ncbi:oxidoreductase, aldo/keto reductase family protein [Ancylostoma ceylanicum]|uniref:Oxidoreductase, aldo/keto reductase family protein n=1 Tax=Ancylostoma ceylanicum TaxID=53326 RepID=A0A0D6LM84_9BILA|nr:oxidoreductase, aldo/keto reductase family protein [Ancylostoma ceylanicum]
MPRSVSLAPSRLRNGGVVDVLLKWKPALPPTFVARFHDEAAVRRMQYRRLGQTEMVVSRIGFGSAPIGGMFGNIEDSITQIVEVALRNGINLIDTAYWYGHTRSESILGKLDYARNFDYRADKVLESLMNSLKRLKLTYVDIHDADFEPHRSIILYETLQALEMARRSGKIRYVGLTGSIIDCSTVKIDVVLTYCHGTMNDNSVGEFTFLFQNKGIGVLNGSPLSMGLLTERGPPPWHPAPDFIKEATLAATHYCMSKNMSISKLALVYAFEVPGMSSCIIGMDSIQQVRDNIALCTAAIPLTEVEQRVRDRIMRRYFDRLENAGWSEVDVAAYWKRLKKLGLTALATHRFVIAERRSCGGRDSTVRVDLDGV